MNTFTILFLAALGLSVVIQLWLSMRQIKHVSSHRDHVPNAFADKLAIDDHQKAADYTQTKARFDAVELIYASLLLLGWTLGGGLELLDQLMRATGESLGLGATGAGVIFMISAFLLMSLPDIPFSAWKTFVIEERYGFNKSTARIFVIDLIKGAILAIVISLPLAWVVLWLMQNSGTLWWLYVWLVWTGFIVFMQWAYPAWIAPLFNKFTPLDDQALAQRINKLMTRCGFSSNGILVMDGSRRSGHGNAYFTGFGANKRIVFFDTLLETLTGEEVEAVLAHELGHFKHKHVTKRMLTMTGISLLALALLGWLMQQNWFFTGLGMTLPSTHAALVLFFIAMPVFSFYLHPLSSLVSRKQEFQADDYAATQSSAPDLINALVKLYRENSSTLTPDPLYSAFHDSHPPAPIRVAHLSSRLT